MLKRIKKLLFVGLFLLGLFGLGYSAINPVAFDSVVEPAELPLILAESDHTVGGG